MDTTRSSVLNLVARPAPKRFEREQRQRWRFTCVPTAASPSVVVAQTARRKNGLCPKSSSVTSASGRRLQDPTIVVAWYTAIDMRCSSATLAAISRYGIVNTTTTASAAMTRRVGQRITLAQGPVFVPLACLTHAIYRQT